jgi:hypothetical protein
VEPGVREYLLRIVNTMSVVLLWMAINSTAGIMFGFAFVEKSIRIGNVLFYIWFLLSFAFLVRWAIRLWRKPIDFEQ